MLRAKRGLNRYPAVVLASQTCVWHGVNRLRRTSVAKRYPSAKTFVICDFDTPELLGDHGAGWHWSAVDISEHHG